jgi:hypothetical protein
VKPCEPLPGRHLEETAGDVHVRKTLRPEQPLGEAFAGRLRLAPQTRQPREVDEERYRALALRQLHEGPEELSVDGLGLLVGNVGADGSPAREPRQEEARGVEGVIGAPLPVGRVVVAVELDEGEILHRRVREDLRGSGDRPVHRLEPVLREREPRLREGELGGGEREERVHAHRALEVVIDHAEDHDVRMPRTHVAPVSQIGLVDPVPVDAEVEHLGVRSERLLELRAPRVVPRQLQPERERVADEGDALVRGPRREAHAGGRAPQSLRAAEVEAVGTAPVATDRPSELRVGDEVRPVEGRLPQERAVARGHVSPVPRQEEHVGERGARPRRHRQRADGELDGCERSGHRDHVEGDRQPPAFAAAPTAPEKDHGGGGCRRNHRGDRQAPRDARQERRERAVALVVEAERHDDERGLQHEERDQQGPVGSAAAHPVSRVTYSTTILPASGRNSGTCASSHSSTS